MKQICVISDSYELYAQLITLAGNFGASICAVTTNAEFSEDLSSFDIDKVVVLKGSDTSYESYGKAVADYLKNDEASLLLVGNTVSGQDLAARTAAYMNAALISDISDLTHNGDAFESTRMLYGGAVKKEEIISQFAVLTVSGGKYDKAAGIGKNVPVTVVDVECDSRVKLLKSDALKKGGANLGDAETVIGVGIGIESQDDYNLITELAGELNAPIGFSRPAAEERDWSADAQYVGISGVTVSPSLYMAIGISGQVQHTVGIRDSKIIVAVNTNEKAPIFKAADYGVVGDLREVVPALIAAIRATK